MRSVLVMAMLAAVASLTHRASGKEAPAWQAGPYLMLDDGLVVEQQGVQRRVNSPSRLPDPIVTGYEDGCFQPYVTVIRDPRSKRFRMWYGVPAGPGNASESRLAYMESEDGIHWIRPHRLLETPPIQFGTSVIDEQAECANPALRFKFAWWKNGGLQVASSPDGLNWKSLAPGPVIRTNHDITGIDWDPIRRRYLGLLSIVPQDGPYKGLRIPHQSVSQDLVHWAEPPWPIVTPNPDADIEKGQTQFYGMSAVLPRGDLLVSLVKVLRDDLNCEPGKTAAELHDSGRPFAGIGYTVVAWSHDGEHWKRETQPFLDRNPQSGTWDRAMAWVDDQMIVGDYTYIYYGGYRWGHKAERFTGRQIGLAHMPRDRYVGFVAGDEPGRLITRSGILPDLQMTINARIDPTGGELRVRAVDEQNKAYPGFDWDDCTPLKGDRVDHKVAWRGQNSEAAGKPVRFEFQLKRATIFSFDLHLRRAQGRP